MPRILIKSPDLVERLHVFASPHKCNCNLEEQEVSWHSVMCHYRLFVEALREIKYWRAACPERARAIAQAVAGLPSPEGGGPEGPPAGPAPLIDDQSPYAPQGHRPPDPSSS